MSRYSTDYAKWVNGERKARGLTRRKVAELARIDASYLTLITREGMLPARDRAARIGRAVCGDPDEGLIRAGYVPAKYQQALLAMHLDNSDQIQPS